MAASSRLVSFSFAATIIGRAFLIASPRSSGSVGNGARTRLESSRDRTKLTSDGSLPWFTLGVRRAIDADWSVALEVLHVPLEVRRPPDFASERDSLTSWRAQLRREFR